MATVIAVWPDNTISVIRMPAGFSMVDLYDEMDAENDPIHAKVYLARGDSDGLYVTFAWKCLDDGTAASPQSNNLRLSAMYGKVKRLKWPPDVQRKWAMTLSRGARHNAIRDDLRTIRACDLPNFPAPPTGTYEVCDIRKMQAFCGVYFAFNDDGSCHYVGESEDVTKRVSSARPEIADRRIGFVRCEKHERKRIEAYFVAMLDPPGNAISTHRMASKG